MHRQKILNCYNTCLSHDVNYCKTGNRAKTVRDCYLTCALLAASTFNVYAYAMNLFFTFEIDKTFSSLSYHIEDIQSTERVR